MKMWCGRCSVRSFWHLTSVTTGKQAQFCTGTSSLTTFSSTTRTTSRYNPQNNLLLLPLPASEHHLFATQLSDFGLSRVLGSKDALAQTFLGTPYYMSPVRSLSSFPPFVAFPFLFLLTVYLLSGTSQSNRLQREIRYLVTWMLGVRNVLSDVHYLLSPFCFFARTDIEHRVFSSVLDHHSMPKLMQP